MRTFNHRNTTVWSSFSLVLLTISSFNSKQCKIHVSNHRCCWNNYSNTGYSCHIRSNWIHNVCNSIYPVCYQKVWWSTAMRFCANRVCWQYSKWVHSIPFDWIYTVVDLYRWRLSYSNSAVSTMVICLELIRM